MAILSLPGHEKSPERTKRSEPGRGEELKAVGERMQPAAEDHVGAPEAVVGTDQPMLDAETLAEGERPRLLGQERVGAALDEEAVVALGLDGAARSGRRPRKATGPA